MAPFNPPLKILSALLILICGTAFNAVAQCSDAGVCAIGKRSVSLRHQVGISYNFGKSGKADGLTFHSLNLESSVQVFENANIFLSLPWSRQSGPLGSTSGIGDLSVLWSQYAWRSGEAQLSVELGGKLATADVNLGGLPQAYQPGLGTNDLIVGASFVEESWNGAVGYQLSRGRSENTLTRLRRGDDVFLRAGYSGDWEDALYTLELLAIKRLRTSSVADASSPGNTFMSVPESDQFQVNILGKVFLPVDESVNLRIITAVPLMQRKVNVDGLTRSLTLSAGLLLTL